MLIDNPEKTYAFLRLTLCIRCIVGYYLKLSVSICFPLHEIVYCSIARVTISSFIAIIAGAIISMKIADCSARRNREPQFPPLMSTTTWSWGTPGTISLQHNQRRGKRGTRHSGEFRDTIPIRPTTNQVSCPQNTPYILNQSQSQGSTSNSV